MTKDEQLLENARKKLRHCAYKLANVSEQYKPAAVEEHEEAAIAFAMAAAICGMRAK
jgi:hypothetical protein